MSEAQAAPPVETPEDWTNTDASLEETNRELKLKDGDDIRMKIVSGPFTFRELYLVVGKTEDGKKDKKKRYAIPFASQMPGYPWRTRHLIEVLVLDGKSKGQHKILGYGKTVAEDLREVARKWGSARKPDLYIARKGSGQLDTEYKVTAVESSVEKGSPSLAPEFNLTHEAKLSTPEDLRDMPPPVSGGRQTDSMSENLSAAQFDLIDTLAGRKGFTAAKLLDFARRITKNEKLAGIEKLTGGEAGKVIDALKDAQ